jgi:hypothetical protein
MACFQEPQISVGALLRLGRTGHRLRLKHLKPAVPGHVPHDLIHIGNDVAARPKIYSYQPIETCRSATGTLAKRTSMSRQQHAACRRAISIPS